MTTDWAEWSRYAVRLMQERNDRWRSDYALTQAPYVWTLEPPELAFRRKDDEVVATLTVVGTASTSEGTFLWSWANDALPAGCIEGMHAVREFGRSNNLLLLLKACSTGGRREGLELAAIAGRILDSGGVFTHESDGVTMFFVLNDFRVRTAGMA